MLPFAVHASSRVLLLLACLLCGAALAADGLTGTTQRISVGMNGALPLRATASSSPALSADGRFVAFLSDAQNFGAVHADTVNVWVKDLATGDLDLVSQSSSGEPANGNSLTAAISSDGRIVVFITEATNLGGAASSSQRQIYVRDRVARTATPLAADAPPAGGLIGTSLAITGDGRYVVIQAHGQVYVRDRVAGTWDLVSATPGGALSSGYAGSSGLAISADGRYLVFPSTATDLVPGQGKNERYVNQMFVRDRQARRTVLITTPPAENNLKLTDSQPAISADGRFITFTGALTDNDLYEARVYVLDRSTGALTTITGPALGLKSDIPVFGSVLSGDGTYLACYAGNGSLGRGGAEAEQEVFVINQAAGTHEQVSVPTGGGSTQLPPVRTFSLDDLMDTLAISADGRSVAFASAQRGLAPNDLNAEPNIFVRDRAAGATRQADLTREGAVGLAPAASFLGVPSGDGRFIAFASEAENLVPGDTNGVADVFVADRQSGTLERVSVSSAGEQADQASTRSVLGGGLTISRDGRWVVFTSLATNLVPGSSPGGSLYNVHLYLRDRTQGTTRRIDPEPTIDPSGDGPDGPYFPSNPVISPDGRFIAYEAAYETISDLWGEVLLWDSRTGKTEVTSADRRGRPLRAVAYNPRLSADGRIVAYDLTWDVVGGLLPYHTYVRDRARGTVHAIPSNAPFAGRAFDTSAVWVSADGDTVALKTRSHTVDPSRESFTGTYLWDWSRGSFSKVPLPKNAESVSWSADGRDICYFDYVQLDEYDYATIAYRWNRASRRQEIVSILPGQSPPGPTTDPLDYNAYDVQLSADGQHVVWGRVQNPHAAYRRQVTDVYVRDFPLVGGSAGTPGHVDLGSVLVPSVLTGTVTIQNLSATEALQVKLPAVAGPFIVEKGAGSTLVPPSGSLALEIVFRPLQRGRYTGTLRVRTSDPHHPELTVQLEARGWGE